MSATTSRSNWAGITSSVGLVMFWWAMFASRPTHAFLDLLLRPYGLFVWFGWIILSIALAVIAAWRKSRWWWVVVVLEVLTFIYFFRGVMS
jgi:hypothetical protein